MSSQQDFKARGTGKGITEEETPDVGLKGIILMEEIVEEKF